MAKRSKKSRRRRPKRAKRVDRVQNKRLDALETVQRKLAFGPLTEYYITPAVGDGGSPITNSGQIYPNQLPLIASIPNGAATAQGTVLGQGRQSDKVYLKNLTMKFQISNENADFTTAPAQHTAQARQMRVIVFWVKNPSTYGTTLYPPTTDIPVTTISSSAAGVETGFFQPTWDLLLRNFNAATSSSNVSNMSAYRNPQLSGSPIVVISDSVHTLGPADLKNSIKRFTVSKSYKSTLLHFTAAGTQAPEPTEVQLMTHGTGITRPNNRRLFVAAYCPSASSHAAPNEVKLSWQTRITYQG